MEESSQYSEVRSQNQSVEPEPTAFAAPPEVEPTGEMPTPELSPVDAAPASATVVEEIPPPTPEPVITTPPTPDPVIETSTPQSPADPSLIPPSDQSQQ